EVAAAYRKQFDRLLPVSSLVRPEEYQHVLRRYNRAATTIDTPPHSTGLAFDIDYRFMSIPEQNFVMNELAQLKREGRIEVLRERAANFHRSEEHTSELQSLTNLVCRLLLEKKKKYNIKYT